jgi:hypothetical protein
MARTERTDNGDSTEGEGFNRALPREKPLTHFPFAKCGPQSCSRVWQLPGRTLAAIPIEFAATAIHVAVLAVQFAALLARRRGFSMNRNGCASWLHGNRKSFLIRPFHFVFDAMR